MFIIKGKKNNEVTEYKCEYLNIYLSYEENKVFNENGIRLLKGNYRNVIGLLTGNYENIIGFELDLDKFDVRFFLVSPVLDKPYDKQIKLTRKNCKMLEEKYSEKVVGNCDEVGYLQVAFEIIRKDNLESIMYVVLD